MKTNIQKLIEEKGIRLFLIDIDGTLKDLSKEHMQVVNDMIFQKKKKELNAKIILNVNSFLMCFVKSGLFPTNKNTQSIVCSINSILFFEKYSKFKKEYIKDYDKLRITFDRCYEMLTEIEQSGSRFILVSKNEQSVNFIKNDEMFNDEHLKISYSKGNKKDAFNQAINCEGNKQKQSIKKSQIVVIGDNFWDDILPAILLKTNFLWCNKYNSKAKKACSSCLPKIFETALENLGEFSIW